MESTETGASLMDNLEFLKEIEKLEAKPRPGMKDVFPEELLTYASQQEVRPAHALTAPQFMMPAATAAPVAEAAQTPAMRPALAVVGFLVMMSIGAGAAALVFHDRVAQIVAQWQSARR